MGSYHSNYLHIADRKKEKGGSSTNLPGYLTTKDFPFKAKINYVVNIFYHKNFRVRKGQSAFDIMNLKSTTNPAS